MDSSNEPVSPFDPYEHVAALTLHEDVGKEPILLKLPEVPPEDKPRSSSSVASAKGRLEGGGASNFSFEGNLSAFSPLSHQVFGSSSITHAIFPHHTPVNPPSLPWGASLLPSLRPSAQRNGAKGWGSADCFP